MVVPFFPLNIRLDLKCKEQCEEGPSTCPCQGLMGGMTEWMKSYIISVRIPLKGLSSQLTATFQLPSVNPEISLYDGPWEVILYWPHTSMTLNSLSLISSLHLINKNSSQIRKCQSFLPALSHHHFTDAEIESQKIKQTCPRIHN